LAETTIQNRYIGLARLKLFWALSRTPHAVLDMATPAFGALLWLDAFPSLDIIILGMITVFAGYTAVYAWNDVIDYPTDQKKARIGSLREADNYLDAVLPRHPMAQGLLTFREGLLWSAGWSIVAITGAYLLNPVCVLIFLAGCGLEAVYCLMLTVSPFRTLISGAVKSSGAVAAVFAVDPQPSLLYVAALFLWLFFWEIGGQNIPADWADVEEDRRLRAQTIPVLLGLKVAAIIVLPCLSLSIILNLVMIFFSQSGFQAPYAIASLIVGLSLLFPPAVKLFNTKKRCDAMSLFNRASYYPVTMLGVVVIKISGLLPGSF
jgi:4-hydroxybenzoate polyprenyltransferase